LDGQHRIASATVVVVGDDLTCEVLARTLAAAGVGGLRLVRGSGGLPREILGALLGSNPDLRVESRDWPSGDANEAGSSWIEALTGCAVAVRSGFEDDPMLRAAVRLGLPVVVARGRDDRIDVVSFRRHGPCPHVPLDVPTQQALPPQEGPGAVVAAHMAAAETLILIAAASTGQSRARAASISFDTGDHDDPVHSVDIPWTPECFACGGAGSEMSFP
jgi:hypothetical protein